MILHNHKICGNEEERYQIESKDVHGKELQIAATHESVDDNNDWKHQYSHDFHQQIIACNNLISFFMQPCTEEDLYGRENKEEDADQENWSYLLLCLGVVKVNFR